MFWGCGGFWFVERLSATPRRARPDRRSGQLNWVVRDRRTVTQARGRADIQADTTMQTRERPEKSELFERFGSVEEAIQAAMTNQLHPRPHPHHRQPKWIAEVGRIDPNRLGKRPRMTHSHQIRIETNPSTREWLKPFEMKPDNEPGRYAIPADRLSDFNARVRRILSIPRI